MRARTPLAALVAVVTTCLLFAASAQAGPLTWSPAMNVDATNTIQSVDCPTTTLCVAGDGNGNVITSTDPTGGAAAWTATNLIGGFVTIEDISCPSTSLCLAVDSTGDVWWSTNPTGGAAAWTQVNIAAANVLNEVDCPTTSLCVISQGSAGNVYWATNPTGPAGAWTPVHIDGTAGEFALSCPTVSLCVTGNDAGPPAVNWTTTPTGLATGWTNVPGADSGPNAGSVMEGMSCPTEALCVGSDDFGNVVTTTNPTGPATAWTTTELAAFPVFWDVSCATTTLCVTVAGSSAWTSTDPTGGAAAWTSDSVFGADQLDAVSCTTAAFCAVAGSNGDLYIGTQATLSVTLAGAGTGSVSGGGIACPGTCSSILPLNTAVTLTPTPGADGSTFSGWSGACTGSGPCNLTMASDRAVIATFDPPSAPAQSSTAPPSPAPPAPPPASPLPAPVASKTANAYPTSGTVRVQAAGSKKFVPLTSPEQVQFGAIFDARKGSVQIVIANGHGGFDQATFSEGEFRLVAAAGGFADLRLVGGSFKGCPRAAHGGSAMVAAGTRGRNVRHLWGSGTGKFRTTGRFASATIRGTRWLTDDYCRGTLVKVAKGAVTVRDLVRRKSRALRAPKSYFAAPRRR